MKHIGTQEIETSRLLLRRFKEEDAQAVFDGYASDPQATEYLTWPVHESVSLTAEILQDWVRTYDDLKQYKWAICLKDKPEEVVGDITASLTESLESLRACEIGYVISRPYWGQGYMSEAMAAVTRYLLLEVGFNRVFARHDLDNIGSGKVMQKAGLQFEGIQRMSAKNNRGIVDMAQYAMLRQDLDGSL